MKDLNLYLDMLWKNITFEFVIKFVIVYFFIIWISLVVWVLKDIRNRTTNLFFQFICVLIPVFLTPFGIFVYLLVRPTKTLYEKYYDEIEENLDLIYEIIEERKKQFEEKINNSIKEEEKIVIKKSINLAKKEKLDSEEKINILKFEEEKEIKEEIKLEEKSEGKVLEIKDNFQNEKREEEVEKILNSENISQKEEKNISEDQNTEKTPLKKISLMKFGKKEKSEKPVKLTKLKRKKF